MIIGIVGYPRLGKSYYAVDLFLSRAYRGRPHFSSCPVWGSYKLNPDDLISLALPRGSVVLLDEVQTMCPARRSLGVPGLWPEMPYEVYELFSQGGKWQFDFIWTCQDGSRVDKALREVTQEWIEIDAPLGRRFPLRRARSYSCMMMQVTGSHWSSQHWFWISARKGNRYDSWAAVGGQGLHPKDLASFQKWDKPKLQ